MSKGITPFDIDYLILEGEALISISVELILELMSLSLLFLIGLETVDLEKGRLLRSQ